MSLVGTQVVPLKDQLHLYVCSSVVQGRLVVIAEHSLWGLPTEKKAQGCADEGMDVSSGPRARPLPFQHIYHFYMAGPV